MQLFYMGSVRRFFATLLLFVMCFSMLPQTASAQWNQDYPAHAFKQMMEGFVTAFEAIKKAVLQVGVILGLSKEIDNFLKGKQITNWVEFLRKPEESAKKIILAKLLQKTRGGTQRTGLAGDGASSWVARRNKLVEKAVTSAFGIKGLDPQSDFVALSRKNTVDPLTGKLVGFGGGFAPFVALLDPANNFRAGDLAINAAKAVKGEGQEALKAQQQSPGFDGIAPRILENLKQRVAAAAFDMMHTAGVSEASPILGAVAATLINSMLQGGSGTKEQMKALLKGYGIDQVKGSSYYQEAQAKLEGIRNDFYNKVGKAGAQFDPKSKQ